MKALPLPEMIRIFLLPFIVMGVAFGFAACEESDSSANQNQSATSPDSSEIAQAQAEFANILSRKIEDLLLDRLDGRFEVMNVPNGYYWGIQFGPNNYYNPKSLAQMDLEVVVGSNDILTLGSSVFSTMYRDVLENIAYVFSESDLELMAQQQASADSQIQAVINTWETFVGPITSQAIEECGCFPPTKLGYIDYQVQERWDSDINQIPTSLQAFREAYQIYQVEAEAVFRLQSASAVAMKRLDNARTNTAMPTAGNGGLQTGAESFYVTFGPFPTQNQINSGLQSLSNRITINVSLDASSSQENTHCDVRIEKNAAISISKSSLFQKRVSEAPEVCTDSSTFEMSAVYEGVTVISTPLTDGILSGDGETGWYDNEILAQAIYNTDQSRTGYTLLGNQFPVDEYFGVDKKFSRVKTWVVSRQPKFTMKYCSGDAARSESIFRDEEATWIKPFEIFGIRLPLRNYTLWKIDSSGRTNCTNVDLGPSLITGTTSPSDATAYVVGGVPSYPPDDI